MQALKSQVCIESKNLEADRAVIDKILAAACDKFSLYDNSDESRVPDTIRSIVERKGFGFGLGGRVVEKSIFVDFNPCHGKESKFDEVHDFILAELKASFGVDLGEILEGTYSYKSTSWK
jgi:hypothetical protein